MKVLVALFVILSVVGSCYCALPIVPCDKNPHSLKIDEIRVFNSTWECDKEPCVLYKGLNISLSVTFENNGADITTLENDVYGIYLHITVPFPDYPSSMKNVCTLGGTSSSCPIKKGDKFTEKVTLPITEAAIHGMNVIAKWELKSGDTMEGCFQAAFKIE